MFDAALRDGMASVTSWYHTIELAPGLTTPGFFDHRSIVPRLPMPGDLTGQRCLDVGTFDGFWAFEMERRGATDVTAIDLLDPSRMDWPPGPRRHATGVRGQGFALAHRALRSRVAHVDCSVYDLDPAVHGHFDFVYLGSLLLHLRDPVRALEAIRRVCRGRLLVVDAIDVALTARAPRLAVAALDGVGRPWWWLPNLTCLAAMVEAAGFTMAAAPAIVFLDAGRGRDRAERSGPRTWVRRAWYLPRIRFRPADLLGPVWAGDAHGVIVGTPA